MKPNKPRMDKSYEVEIDNFIKLQNEVERLRDMIALKDVRIAELRRELSDANEMLRLGNAAFCRLAEFTFGGYTGQIEAAKGGDNRPDLTQAEKQSLDHQ